MSQICCPHTRRLVLRALRSTLVTYASSQTMSAARSGHRLRSEKERGAVIDEPDLLPAHQKVGIARAAIDVGDVRVEPDDVRGALGTSSEIGKRARRRDR